MIHSYNTMGDCILSFYYGKLPSKYIIFWEIYYVYIYSIYWVHVKGIFMFKPLLHTVA